MDTEFEISSCRCDHAGKAYITIKHLRSGALLAIQHLPFEHEHDQTMEQEQDQIAAKAVQLARDAAEFLETEVESHAAWPTAEPRCGAAPREGEPPNAFGFIRNPG